MEEKLTMDDFKEELEASYKAAEESGAQDSEELDPVWATLQQYMDDKEVLNVKIGGVVNAGVIAYVDGVRGFIPASRLSLDHVDDLNEWLNKKIRVRVITVDPEKKRLVLSARELEARKEIKLEEYAGLINIEARTMIDMASKLYIPSVIAFVNSVASSMNTVKSAYAQADTSAQQTILVRASSLLADAQKALDELKKVTDAAETAKEYHDTVLPAMAALRAPIDELETIVDSEYWPVPTYGELMFEV